jgi:hypothetical protein
MNTQVLTVVEIAPGELQINYAWLPNWLGLDRAVVEELEEKVLVPLLESAQFENADQACLEGHYRVCKYLAAKFPQHEGLFNFLDALKFVTQKVGT